MERGGVVSGGTPPTAGHVPRRYVVRCPLYPLPGVRLRLEGELMHVHDSALQAAIVFAFVVLIGGAWRVVSTRLSDKPAGQAMAFIY